MSVGSLLRTGFGIIYNRNIQQSMNQSENSCRSCSLSAKHEKGTFHCPRFYMRVWSRETGSAVPFRVGPLILHTQPETGAYSRDSSLFPPIMRPHIIPSTAFVSVPSLSGHAIAYRWCSLPRTYQYKVSSPQGSLLFMFQHGFMFIHLSFSTPIVGVLWTCIVCVIQKPLEQLSKRQKCLLHRSVHDKNERLYAAIR